MKNNIPQGQESVLLKAKESLSLRQCQSDTITAAVKIFYNKGLFDTIQNKCEAIEKNLHFNDESSLQKHGNGIENTEGEYKVKTYLSDVNYGNSRGNFIECWYDMNLLGVRLDINYLEDRTDLTDEEINYIISIKLIIL